MTKLMALLNTTHHVGTPHHPQSQGRAERNIGVMTRTLKILTLGEGENWEPAVPLIAWLMNSAESVVTGKTPYEMMFGFKPVSNLRLIAQAQELLAHAQCILATDPDDYVAALVSRMATLTNRVRQVQEDQMRKRNALLKKDPWPIYAIGEPVLVYFDKVSDKLDSHWRGPFRVMEHHDGNIYTVVHVHDAARTFKIHAERMRSFDLSRLSSKLLQRMRFKDNTYFIEEVLDHRRDADDKLEVLIHWEGYESSQDSWVRASTVQHTQPYKDYFLKLKTTSKRSSQTSQVATNTSTHVSSTPSRVQPSRKRKMKRMPEPSKGQTKPRAKRARRSKRK